MPVTVLGLTGRGDYQGVRHDEYIVAVNNQLQSVCEEIDGVEYHSPFIEFDDPNLMWDGLHYNTAGYDVFIDCLLTLMPARRPERRPERREGGREEGRGDVRGHERGHERRDGGNWRGHQNWPERRDEGTGRWRRAAREPERRDEA